MISKRLCFSVNPDLVIGGYPDEWTEFVATVEGFGCWLQTGRLPACATLLQAAALLVTTLISSVLMKYVFVQPEKR